MWFDHIRIEFDHACISKVPIHFFKITCAKSANEMMKWYWKSWKKSFEQWAWQSKEKISFKHFICWLWASSLFFFYLKPDLHETKKFAGNPKEDIVLVENDITRSVMSFSTNTMSSFGFRANFRLFRLVEIRLKMK